MPSSPSKDASVLPDHTTPRQSQLDLPLGNIRGIDAIGAKSLARLNLFTAGDLLYHLPVRWEDRSSFRSIGQLAADEYVTLCGAISSVSSRRPNQRICITEAIIRDDTGVVKLIWFNQPYVEKAIQPLVAKRARIIVYGQVRISGWSPEIVSPEWEEAGDPSDSLSMGRLVPIYRTTHGIRQTRIRKYVSIALERLTGSVADSLPAAIRNEQQLIELDVALRSIHFPASSEALTNARRRLIFDEFFLFQCGIALKRRRGNIYNSSVVLRVEAAEIASRLARLAPFALTGAQVRAIDEISTDVRSGHVMNRLLQGDVGSGKTVIALAAMLMAVDNGRQAALMAPTEILAQQHALVLKRLLANENIHVALSTGSQTRKQRNELQQWITAKEPCIVVGTHALIQQGVEFSDLGLVIVDEQHRFGVLQRQALALKGSSPHILVMTATPIPRTLTLTVYGDLDVSVLDELPPGRKPIVTHWKRKDRRDHVYNAARQLLSSGRQAYVVCPLIEESEKLQVASATELAEEIAGGLLPEFRVGLLHGQMRPDEKERVMLQFKEHTVDILVSTTVIEVGIDVPNASIIIIEDADRFGLAQLHQLRGRVGRGQHASYCILIAEPKTDVGRARLEIMTQTRDGFVVANEDLRLRGPGEYAGIRQSGLPEFTIGDIVRDGELLAACRVAAFNLIDRDPELDFPEHLRLKSAIERQQSARSLAHVS